MQLNPKGHFTGFLNDYIRFAKDRDCAKAKERLLARWKTDTMRFDILQEVGKVSNMAGDHATAAKCYDRSLATMKMFGMDLFKEEYLRIGITYEKVGQKQKAAEYITKFKDFADHDQTIYKDLYLMAYASYKEENDKAISMLKRFAKERDYFLYWILLMPDDPLFDDVKKHPDFKASIKTIETKYWRMHEEMKEKFGREFEDL
jgi:tetratricopeptide (TPR) repeat protein